MTNYARLSEKPLPFLSLTAYTVAEFQALLPTFSAAFLRHMQENTLDAKKREKRRFVAYRNSPLPTMEDKLLFILMYLRKATTQDIFGEVFHMPQPVANKWIHIPASVMFESSLGRVEGTPRAYGHGFTVTPRSWSRSIFRMAPSAPLNDRKRRKPKPPSIAASGKRHTVKNNLLVNASAKIILLTPTCEGKKHDKKNTPDETHLTLPKGQLSLPRYRFSRVLLWRMSRSVNQ